MLPTLAQQNPLSHCGTERWRIKTLDDAGVKHINNIPQPLTVDALRQLPVPSNFSSRNDITRYAPVENTEYTVRAALLGFKEEADRDLHVVLADPSDRMTMIGEIPDPNCSTVQASGHATQIAAVRTQFINCFGAPPANGRFKRFDGTMIAELTGVGFFDLLHGQTGVAPNGIELHPILRVRTVSGACPTGYAAHPGATGSPHAER